MIVAFIFSMAISYNAYANEKINLREFSAYIGDFSEQKYDVIKQKVMELQNKYEETQNADVMNEMFVYLTLDCKFRFIGSPIPVATVQCFRS